MLNHQIAKLVSTFATKEKSVSTFVVTLLKGSNKVDFFMQQNSYSLKENHLSFYLSSLYRV